MNKTQINSKMIKLIKTKLDSLKKQQQNPEVINQERILAKIDLCNELLLYAKAKNLNISNVSDSVFDDKIDEWHNTDTPLKLYEYLGLTKEQYEIWLKTPDIIEKHYR